MGACSDRTAGNSRIDKKSFLDKIACWTHSRGGMSTEGKLFMFNHADDIRLAPTIFIIKIIIISFFNCFTTNCYRILTGNLEKYGSM